ncbi:ABC transporter ATP-binding protein [Paraburkholderia fungorum]|uniref:ABC transporter ATP-binding protein n=1 Tax=Paraburkholderia fungorum TaxID=134537 RepID=A0AAP5QK12_9BURK|nr:ABC transporter ATP-binding protein [Paraburkholderia fungorum]MDT8843622.1 ABC transporter ATP-binding protein [Paraburkholderia fungorum]
MTLLRTEKLYKAYGDLVVTRDVDFDVVAGERHVIIGPNGAGKTSFVHQLTGQIRPSSGHVFFMGRDVTGASPDALCHMGMARTFQKNNLFMNLGVRENVRLAVQAKQGGWYQALRSVATRRTQWERVDGILESVRLTGACERVVSSLSYGEQRQLELAIALAAEPQLLLLDEPTSGMSPAETERMIELVRELPQSMAILMIEHDMKVVFSLADRITVLYYGEVLASGSPDDIQGNARVREVYLGGKH